MGNYKGVLFGFIMFIGLVITGGTDSLAANFKEFESKSNVDPFHNFVIKFNEEIDENTVNNTNIYVLDSTGAQLTSKVTLNADNRSVKLQSPEKGYESGETYTMYITNGVHTKYDKSLKQETRMVFTISQRQNDSYLRNTENVYVYRDRYGFERIYKYHGKYNGEDEAFIGTDMWESLYNMDPIFQKETEKGLYSNSELLIPYPIKVGGGWEDREGLKTVLAANETVTVAAGTFENVVVIGIQITEYITEYKYYAKDVGLILSKTHVDAPDQKEESVIEELYELRENPIGEVGENEIGAINSVNGDWYSDYSDFRTRTLEVPQFQTDIGITMAKYNTLNETGKNNVVISVLEGKPYNTNPASAGAADFRNAFANAVNAQISAGNLN
ncbi:Ig-like domain-containing protein [Domibacillus sp. PGB-M46]|uniref:Ig-like domain-containing protein n=1 Tax=Domibacillus sp. PGB-M46 TaxID=2910255 RepID=UPI001F56B6EA|nr:Ig-like domain-containing protein [Domibacillus sp. PGB-M46]MCI2256525.1 Ig-like domain-containing protein [Domibacillus sp. PGB-M46]